MTGDTTSLIDPDRTASLRNGRAAAVTVNADGTVALWLVRTDQEPGDDHGCTCSTCAPHEQDGPLPPEWQHRIGSTWVYPKCGAPTLTTGQPCRAWVAHPGDRCHHHRTTSARRSNA